MKKYYLFLLVLIQCSAEVDFPTPTNPTFEAPKVNTSLKAVWERVQQSESGFIQFSTEEEELWLSGVVISSDAAGNFYKEVYLQDTPQNPTRGARMLLDQTALHTFVPVGSRIYVKLNGLGAGLEGGVLSLGSYEADGVSVLPQPLIQKHLKRSGEQLELKPLLKTINQLSTETRGLWVKMESLQFAKSELGKTFSAEAFDQFDGERWSVSCQDFRSLIVTTSVFSKFKSLLVDSLSGTIVGIHTRDYYNEKDILKINTPKNIVFTNSRCDPFFEESFETHPLGRFAAEGWINWVEQGTQYWEVYEDENSLGQSLRIGSYRSRDTKTICWLISPPMRIEERSSPQFSFRTSTAFADNSLLEVFYSNDFNGESAQIEKATWKSLGAKIASADDNDQLWIESGAFAIPSSITPVFFAFRYTGSGKTAQDGTYELDDIRVFEP